MKIIKAHAFIDSYMDGQEMIENIERIARTCYKSESKIDKNSAAKMISSLIKSGHESMLEHESVTVRFIVDRGVSHELVRHRLASFAQESTRYCNYSSDKFNSELTFIKPCFLDENTEGFKVWKGTMEMAEMIYKGLTRKGLTTEQARIVLPASLKTEVVMTANLREWRHFFKLRTVGTAGKPHPQMLEVTIPLLNEFKEQIPIVFDDLIIK